MTYWHFTCSHGHDALGDAGELLPAQRLTDRALPWPSQYAWLTDLSTPIRDALGLTMRLVVCDRTAYRYRVTDATNVIPWTIAARIITRPQREELEGAPGARPAHWYVALESVPIVLDQLTKVRP